jgi:hypothetical protein
MEVLSLESNHKCQPMGNCKKSDDDQNQVQDEEQICVRVLPPVIARSQHAEVSIARRSRWRGCTHFMWPNTAGIQDDTSYHCVVSIAESTF